MDSSNLQNKLSDSAPIVKSAPVQSVSQFVNKDGGSVAANAGSGAGNFSIGTTVTDTTGVSSGTTKSTTTDSSRAKEMAALVKDQTGLSISETQAASIGHSKTALDQFTGQVGTGVAKALGIGAFAGMKLRPAQRAAGEAVMQKAQGAAVSDLAKKDPGFIGRLMGEAGVDAKAEAVGEMIDYSGAALTVGALGLELFTGIGVAATPATTAAMLVGTKAAKTGIMAKIKTGGKEVAKDAALLAASRGPGGAERVAAAIAGDTKALFQASVQDAMKRDETATTSKALKKDSSVSVTDADKIADTFRASQGKAYGETASAGVTNTSQVTLDNDNLVRAGTNGLGSQSGEQMRQNGAATRAFLQTARGTDDKLLYSQDKQDWAKVKVAQATMGRSISGKDAAGNEIGKALEQYRDNVLFEHFLTGAVNGSYGSNRGTGLAKGSDLSSEPNIKHTDAKAATQGHWAKKGANPAANPTETRNPESERWGLAQWKDGGDPKNSQAHAAAAKAGYSWVPGTPAVAAKDELQPEQSQENKDLKTTVSHAGLGNNVGKSAQYKTVRDSVIKSGDKAMQTRFDSLVSSKVALDKMAPGDAKAFEEKKLNEEIAIAAIGVAGAAASAVEGYTSAVRNAASLANPTGQTGSPQPGSPPTKQKSSVASKLGKVAVLAATGTAAYFATKAVMGSDNPKPTDGDKAAPINGGTSEAPRATANATPTAPRSDRTNNATTHAPVAHAQATPAHSSDASTTAEPEHQATTTPVQVHVQSINPKGPIA